MLILTMRIRSRIQEAGVLLAVGKNKAEIIGQFVLETATLMLFGFLLAFIFSGSFSSVLNQILFGSLLGDTPAGILQANSEMRNYLQPNIPRSLALFSSELAIVVLAVIVSSGAVLSLKPKDILSKIS